MSLNTNVLLIVSGYVPPELDAAIVEKEWRWHNGPQSLRRIDRDVDVLPAAGVTPPAPHLTDRAGGANAFSVHVYAAGFDFFDRWAFLAWAKSLPLSNTAHSVKVLSAAEDGAHGEAGLNWPKAEDR